MGVDYGAAFDVNAWPMPVGVCGYASWNLLKANSALARLMGIEHGQLEVGSLASWFGEGTLESASGADPVAPKGRLFFRHANGMTYLVGWWPCESKCAARCVAIQELPCQYLDRTAQRSLREMDSILDFIHDGIWVIDGNGITTRINRAMERIAGIRASEVVGRHVSEPLREGRFKTCVTLRALEEKRTVTLFDDYSNGKRCLNTSTPVFDSKGNVWRVIAAIRDITELDSLKERLSRLEVETLAHRMRVKCLEDESMSGLLGQSASLQRVLQVISKAAHSDVVTLIQGETGTGKTLAARIIHEMSSRGQRPFVAINCGAIPPSLIESELFGYEKGAFTGAAKNGKPGMLELASGGTLLLDEIGELSLPMQARLLHILDGQPIYRVGSTRPINMDARILAATNRPLSQMVAEGSFRQDLFYRLAVLCIEMPPLRQRQDDILLLAWHFLRLHGKGKQLSPSVERLFMDYDWPGNVRQLQSVVQSLATLCEGAVIMPEDLPSAIRNEGASKKMARKISSLPDAIAKLEKDMLIQALAECGSTYKAAASLGISQSSVARKARKYGIPCAWPHGQTISRQEQGQ